MVLYYWWEPREKTDEKAIRYYISRELLPPPLKGGRGAAYGEVHKIRIEKIKELQAQGMMLAEIRHVFSAGEGRPVESRYLISERRSPSSKLLGEELPARVEREVWEDRPAGAPSVGTRALTLPEPETWRAYEIGRDAVVMLRAGTSPWRTRRLLNALGRFAAEIGNDDKKDVGIDDENKKENEDE
jgi:DNA-binding transcriptional MerR regulator